MKKALLLFAYTTMNLTSQAQQWLDTQLYPFQEKFVQLNQGKMHYVDEGQGDVILFVHGTPTWSFLYRDIIKSLAKNYRCIAIDHLGFGLSEKPNSFEGTPQAHAKNLEEFLVKLDLQKVTLVVHDFGGPIGLGAGINNADRIEKVVLFNTWLWATKDNKQVQKLDRTINSWLGKFLYLNFNISPKYLLKQGFVDKRKLTKKIHKHYLAPFRKKASRNYLLAIAKSLMGSSDWYESRWNQLEVLREKPFLIIWGTQDNFITTKDLDKWKKRLPNAAVVELDCGHFVQEEMHEETIVAISQFME